MRLQFREDLKENLIEKRVEDLQEEDGRVDRAGRQSLTCLFSKGSWKYSNAVCKPFWTLLFPRTDLMRSAKAEERE